MPRFAESRYYPVNTDQKVIHFEAFRRKSDCSKFPNCKGILGSAIASRWPELQSEGYTVDRSSPERRGGGGRGQGRHPKANPTLTVNIRTTETAHRRLKEHVLRLRQITRKAETMLDVASALTLKAKTSEIASNLQPMEKEDRQVVLTKDAATYLDRLVEQAKVLKPDLRVGQGNVFAAIVERYLK